MHGFFTEHLYARLEQLRRRTGSPTGTPAAV
jgi:hypothetical protein